MQKISFYADECFVERFQSRSSLEINSSTSAGNLKTTGSGNSVDMK